MTSTPELPNPSECQSPEDHRAISLMFLDHAETELAGGHRLQASEKAWGAVAHQFKAIGEQRGWNHEGHARFYDMAHYLDQEYASPNNGAGRSPNLTIDLSAIDAYHRNYYENERTSREIQKIIGHARKMVAELEELRHRPRGPYTIRDPGDRGVVRRLTGHSYPVGTTSGDGFINQAQLDDRQGRWGQYKEDESDDFEVKDGSKG